MLERKCTTCSYFEKEPSPECEACEHGLTNWTASLTSNNPHIPDQFLLQVQKLKDQIYRVHHLMESIDMDFLATFGDQLRTNNDEVDEPQLECVLEFVDILDNFKDDFEDFYEQLLDTTTTIEERLDAFTATSATAALDEEDDSNYWGDWGDDLKEGFSGWESPTEEKEEDEDDE